MKKTLLFLTLFVFALMFSCQRDPEAVSKNGIPEDIMTKLEAAGFSTREGLRKHKDGYIVEYDIFLTEKTLDELIAAAPRNDKNGRVEHYRTSSMPVPKMLAGLLW